MTGNIYKNTLLFVYGSLLSRVLTFGNTFPENVENSEPHIHKLMLFRRAFAMNFRTFAIKKLAFNV
jgi:hypothetical protein